MAVVNDFFEGGDHRRLVRVTPSLQDWQLSTRGPAQLLPRNRRRLWPSQRACSQSPLTQAPNDSIFGLNLELLTQFVGDAGIEGARVGFVVGTVDKAGVKPQNMQALALVGLTEREL